MAAARPPPLGLTARCSIVESKRKRGVGAHRPPAKLGLAGCQPTGHTGNAQAMAPLRDVLNLAPVLDWVKRARIPEENAPCLSIALTPR